MLKRTAISLAALLLSVTNPAAATEPIFAPGENLAIQGIPAVPQSLVDRVNRYTNFRSASLNSWHPKKREMLVSTRFGDVAQVHQVSMPLGMRKQLTFFPERVSNGSYAPIGGKYFIFSKDIGGNEFNQTYRYDLESGNTTLLTDGKSRNSLGTWANKTDRVAYSSTRRTGKDNDFYIMDPANPSENKLISQNTGGGWSVLDWSTDDRTLLALEYLSANKSNLWAIDIATGTKTRITPEGPEVAYTSAFYSKDGKGIYMVSDRESEFSRLAYVDIKTNQPTYLTSNISWDVEETELSPDGKYIAIVSNEAGISILRVLDTTTRKEIKLTKLPTGVILGVNWRKDDLNNPELGLTFLSATQTADVYSIAIKTKAITRWTESETGGLKTDRFSNAELINWKSFDNLNISGLLYRPIVNKFSGKRPVIIDVHGGPEGQSRPYFLGRRNYILNEMGVAMIFPNVRGSLGYGKTFLTLDNGFKREDSVKDIGALLDWIKQQPDLDSDRILITGGSYGGYMSLAAAVKYNNRIRGSIDIVGISNFVSFLERTEGYR